MELFYSSQINDGLCVLEGQESVHCSRVLRHKEGDVINVIDGRGVMMICRIMNILKNSVECQIISSTDNFGGHPYRLVMAVAPTKNIDRYEWFLEKGTEFGIDAVVPIAGDYSERKIINLQRSEKIIISAAKQSQKALFPIISEIVTVRDFIGNIDSEFCQKFQLSGNCLKLIAYCGNMTKKSIGSAVDDYLKKSGEEGFMPSIIVMIGPEGDFSPEEMDLAVSKGFVPIHLGSSRLRTETAAVAAVSNIYFSVSEYILHSN